MDSMQRNKHNFLHKQRTPPLCKYILVLCFKNKYYWPRVSVKYNIFIKSSILDFQIRHEIRTSNSADDNRTNPLLNQTSTPNETSNLNLFPKNQIHWTYKISQFCLPKINLNANLNHPPLDKQILCYYQGITILFNIIVETNSSFRFGFFNSQFDFSWKPFFFIFLFLLKPDSDCVNC